MDKDDQNKWENLILTNMISSGWICDRNDESTLGFSLPEGDKLWIKDYNKDTRRFVQYNGNQIVNLVQTKSE